MCKTSETNNYKYFISVSVERHFLSESSRKPAELQIRFEWNGGVASNVLTTKVKREHVLLAWLNRRGDWWYRG
jgi:hypothetical protein